MYKMRSDHVTNECYLLFSLIFWKLKDDFDSKLPPQNGCERERKKEGEKCFAYGHIQHQIMRPI